MAHEHVQETLENYLSFFSNEWMNQSIKWFENVSSAVKNTFDILGKCDLPQHHTKNDINLTLHCTIIIVINSSILLVVDTDLYGFWYIYSWCWHYMRVCKKKMMLASNDFPSFFQVIGALFFDKIWHLSIWWM